MTLRLGEFAPDFEADTTARTDPITRLDRRRLGCAVSHPKNYTPVCTTELGYMAKIKSEFDRRGVKIIGLSVDPVAKHAGGPTTSRKPRASHRTIHSSGMPISAWRSSTTCCPQPRAEIQRSALHPTTRRCAMCS